MKKLGILMLCTVIILIIGCGKGDDDAMGGKTKTEYMLDYMKEKYDEEFVVDKFNYEVPTNIGDQWYIHVKDHPEIEAYVVGGQYESDEYVINDNYYHVMNMKAYEEIANEVVGKELDGFHVFVDGNLGCRVSKNINKNTKISEAFTKESGISFDTWIYTSTNSVSVDECEAVMEKLLISYSEKNIDANIYMEIYDEEGYQSLRDIGNGLRGDKKELVYMHAFYKDDLSLFIRMKRYE